jgi:hypothetical protein
MAVIRNPLGLVKKIVQGFTDNIGNATVKSGPDYSLWTFKTNDWAQKPTYTIRLSGSDRFAISANSMSITGSLSMDNISILDRMDVIGNITQCTKINKVLRDLLCTLEAKEIELSTVSPLQKFLEQLHVGNMLAEDFIDRR